MRNPINSILATNLKLKQIAEELSLLQDQERQQKTEQMTQLVEIQACSTKLLNMYVCDLLCMSQIENGSFRQNNSYFSLTKAVEEVIALQQDKIESKVLTVTTELVGFEGEDPQVRTDEMRLQQVLLNYLSNAIKFTPDAGSIKIQIELSRENQEEPGILKVKVIDSGIGISEEDQTKLFKLFGFIEEVRDSMNTQGIGMGLYISKQLVERFGGRVGVVSEPGNGSIFSFSFKLNENEEERVEVFRQLNPNYPQRRQVLNLNAFEENESEEEWNAGFS